MKKLLTFLVMLSLLLLCVGCGTPPVTPDPDRPHDPEPGFSEDDRAFRVKGSDLSGVLTEGSVTTIRKGGEYTLRGTLTGGQILIDVPSDEAVILELDGVSIHSEDAAPIAVSSAGKLVVKAKRGTVNLLSDERAKDSAAPEVTEDAALYAPCDLELAGYGGLIVKSLGFMGIHSTKDITVKHLNLKVTASGHAVKGNRSVTMESGEVILLSRGGDGIHTSNSSLSAKGNQKGSVAILGGLCEIHTVGDGIDAAYDFEMSGGTLVINTGENALKDETGEELTRTVYLAVPAPLYTPDSTRFGLGVSGPKQPFTVLEPVYVTYRYENGALSYLFRLDFSEAITGAHLMLYSADQFGETPVGYGPQFTVDPFHDLISVTSVSGNTVSASISHFEAADSIGGSAKGIKAKNNVMVSGGTLEIHAADDGIHATRGTLLDNGQSGVGNVSVTGGNVTIASTDDAIHADYTFTLDGGNIRILSSYEGVEANTYLQNSGNVVILAEDDGINAGGKFVDATVTINGGYLDVTVHSDTADGIDSNGDYLQNGGFVISRAATTDRSGDASGLEIKGECRVTGGTMVVVGTSPLLPSSDLRVSSVRFPSSASSGDFLFRAGQWRIAGSEIEFTLDRDYVGMWIASASLPVGGTYTLSGPDEYSWVQSAKQVEVTE